MSILAEIQANLDIVQVALPTKGRWYTEGEEFEKGVDYGEIDTISISMMEEIAFQNPVLVLTGGALERTLRRGVRGVREPKKLCDLDVKALLIGIRIASHGPEMEMTHQCSSPTCGESFDIKVDLNRVLASFTPFDDEIFDRMTVRLDKFGHVVHLRPVIVEDMQKIMLELAKSQAGISNVEDEDIPRLLKDTEFLKRYQKNFDNMFDITMDVVLDSIIKVVSKNGVEETDRNVIREWFSYLPSEEGQKVVDAVNVIVEYQREASTITTVCPSCGNEERIAVDLDPARLFTQRKTSRDLMSSAS